MVRWLGMGMPGLMVVPRKPTPIGLELHTLCCSLSGILVYFEVYEGKKAMESKEFCDKYPKSVALSLRCTKPYHSSVRAFRIPAFHGCCTDEWLCVMCRVGPCARCGFVVWVCSVRAGSLHVWNVCDNERQDGP